MEVPYTLYTDDEQMNPENRQRSLPEWCKYPLSFAEKKQYFKASELELLSQQSNYATFFIDLVQIEVKKSTYIPFVIHDKQLYMYFMLKGSLIYTTEKKKPIIKTQANMFSMSYYDKGSYLAYAKKGSHIALIVSIDPEWIESIADDYHNIQSILKDFVKSKRPYAIMSQLRMDRKIQRWLFKIYSYSQKNKGALDGNLRKYVSLLLEYYDSILKDQDNDVAFKIKSFVDQNYSDFRLSVKFLTDHFHMTERTLLNIFKRRYHQSIQQYYTDLRIEKAIASMALHGMTIKDVYMEVGYADERAFRYALEQYQKRNK